MKKIIVAIVIFCTVSPIFASEVKIPIVDVRISHRIHHKREHKLLDKIKKRRADRKKNHQNKD